MAFVGVSARGGRISAEGRHPRGEGAGASKQRREHAPLRVAARYEVKVSARAKPGAQSLDTLANGGVSDAEPARDLAIRHVMTHPDEEKSIVIAKIIEENRGECSDRARGTRRFPGGTGARTLRRLGAERVIGVRGSTVCRLANAQHAACSPSRVEDPVAQCSHEVGGYGARRCTVRRKQRERRVLERLTNQVVAFLAAGAEPVCVVLEQRLEAHEEFAKRAFVAATHRFDQRGVGECARVQCRPVLIARAEHGHEQSAEDANQATVPGRPRAVAERVIDWRRREGVDYTE